LINRIEVPTWADWFRKAGLADADVSRGLRFNSADHALDAAGEGAGVLLAHQVLAYDELRTGRLVIPVDLTLETGRAYHVVWARRRRQTVRVDAFRAWIRQEVAALDWKKVRGR
jgi:LysR family glycine cleavage system transcriptional activator